MHCTSAMVNSDDTNGQSEPTSGRVDVSRCRYPYCIVWTPIPLITWLIPIIGHMGIGTSSGVIRDFAGSYFVSQDDMGFGKPTKYWQLSVENVIDGSQGWDDAVKHSSDIYMHRMHNLFCDNCHSHVALSLNLMRYNGKSNYNMVNVFFLSLLHSKYVSIGGFLKTWIPFLCILILIILLTVFVKM